MRTTHAILILALVAQPTAIVGQSSDDAARRHQGLGLFGISAEQDFAAVAATYSKRLASPGIRLGPGDQTSWERRVAEAVNLRLEPSGQTDPEVVEESVGGSRFGGPLLWAMVIIGATTVGFVYLGIRLSPEKSVNPGGD